MEHGDLVNRSMAELDAVHRLASFLSADQHVVDDLVHATFQRAFQAAAGEPNLAAHDLRPWLFKLLVDVSKARLGDPFTPQAALELALSAPGAVVAGRTPCCYDLSMLDWDGASERLAEAVRELPLAYRTVFRPQWTRTRSTSRPRPTPPHPVLIWRSAGLVYYVVADEAATADAALAATPTAPKVRKA